MKLALDYEARVPIRAAVAVALALALGEASDPRLRWYWAVMVAAVLVNGTWGEGTKRGLTRFAMTILGAAAGWDLSVLASHSHAARIAILLASVALAVYFRGVNYGWFTFFLTVYVVSLFEVLETTTRWITLLRVYQTFVGCGIAMAAALFVPMQRASEQWELDAAELVKVCRAAARRSYDRLLESAGAAGAAGAVHQTGVIPQLDKLRNSAELAGYEAVLDRAAHRRRKDFMEHAWQLAQATLSLDSVAANEPPALARSGFRDELARLRAMIAGDTERSVFDAASFDAFRDRVADARRDGGLTAGDYLILNAVAQFSAEIAAIAHEAERGLGLKGNALT